MQDSRKQKVLLLITKSNWGGAQRYVFDLATHLDTTVFDVVVALGGNGKLKGELERGGIRVVTLPSLDRDISLMKEFRVVRELWKLLGDECPHILHINSSKAGGLGTLLGRMRRIPLIIFTAHGWAFNEDRPYWERLCIKGLHYLTVLLSHVTIAVSKEIRSQMHLPGIREKFVMIHNGRSPIDFMSRNEARAFFEERIPKLRAYREDPWSVTIAELHPIKQHDVTVMALRDVVREFPTLRHIIIGEGEERARLETLIQEHHLEENVFLCGALFEAAQYLKAFDISILASRSEALAYVVIEAGMAGLPIIASNVGGIPEIVTDEKDGALFPQGDVRALSEAILGLLTDTERRTSLGLRAYERAKEFGLSQCLEKTVSVYSSN